MQKFYIILSYFTLILRDIFDGHWLKRKTQMRDQITGSGNVAAYCRSNRQTDHAVQLIDVCFHGPPGMTALGESLWHPMQLDLRQHLTYVSAREELIHAACASMFVQVCSLNAGTNCLCSVVALAKNY
jgi:hypothetical protein